MFFLSFFFFFYCALMCLPCLKDAVQEDQIKHLMYIPTAQPSDQAPNRSESQFSASYWAPFLTLFTVNGLSVALLMRSLVLCNQVLSELRRVHFTGSQGTRSNQNAVFPPVCNNTTITFHHCCAVIHS